MATPQLDDRDLDADDPIMEARAKMIQAMAAAQPAIRRRDAERAAQDAQDDYEADTAGDSSQDEGAWTRYASATAAPGGDSGDYDQQAPRPSPGGFSSSGGDEAGSPFPTSSSAAPPHEQVMADINGVLAQLQQMPMQQRTTGGGGGGGGGYRARATFAQQQQRPSFRLRPDQPGALTPAQLARGQTMQPGLTGLTPVQIERRNETRARTVELASSLRTFEDLLSSGEPWSPTRKAAAIKAHYGFDVDPRDLKRGNVWWRRQQT